ncbi:Crossover junction endodeoxyribonuclease RuvC (EC 3.1.22.4), partial [Pseudomonas sp. FEN]
DFDSWYRPRFAYHRLWCGARYRAWLRICGVGLYPHRQWRTARAFADRLPQCPRGDPDLRSGNHGHRKGVHGEKRRFGAQTRSGAGRGHCRRRRGKPRDRRVHRDPGQAGRGRHGRRQQGAGDDDGHAFAQTHHQAANRRLGCPGDCPVPCAHPLQSLAPWPGRCTEPWRSPASL